MCIQYAEIFFFHNILSSLKFKLQFYVVELNASSCSSLFHFYVIIFLDFQLFQQSTKRIQKLNTGRGGRWVWLIYWPAWTRFVRSTTSTTSHPRTPTSPATTLSPASTPPQSLTSNLLSRFRVYSPLLLSYSHCCKTS